MSRKSKYETHDVDNIPTLRKIYFLISSKILFDDSRLETLLYYIFNEKK